MSRTPVLILVALSMTSGACTSPEPPTLFAELSRGNLELYASYVRPTDDESGWRDIPWQPTFAEGMRAAGREGRPLLFWAMNGHPLGCT